MFSVFMFLARAVTRVVNTYGPQTRSGGCQGGVGEHQRGTTVRDCGNAAIEERLQNIETHLKLPSGEGPRKVLIIQMSKVVVWHQCR